MHTRVLGMAVLAGTILGLGARLAGLNMEYATLAGATLAGAIR